MSESDRYRNYDDAYDPKYKEPYAIPVIKATEDAIKGLGNLVMSYDDEEILVTPWPVTGTRKLCPGTGIGGGVTVKPNDCLWEGDMCYAIPKSSPDNWLAIGRLGKGEGTGNRKHVLVGAINYHPDGGQVFYPTEKKPFLALLAPPGDDVKLEDLRALYFDGSCGLQVHPGVWHQALYPIDDEISFFGKQYSVNACVFCHFPSESNRYVSISLDRLA